MKRAFDLSLKGLGTVSPNPLVGAVIVKNGEIISEGFHKRSGEGHAEYNAIMSSKQSVKNSTLYCTLEPCCHLDKKTPPCTALIIEKKISKVVISNLDPNPKVSGKGVEALNAAGIEVEVGLLSDLGEQINRVFFLNMRKGRPYVHLKQALGLDGRTATSTGDSKWITSEVARSEVHQMRYEYDAVMVGSKTAIQDDPSLTAREGSDVRKVPKRVVMVGSTPLPNDLQLLRDEYADSTILVHNKGPDAALEDLYSQGVRSILLEGGSQLASTFINAGLVDQVTYYISPKLIGNGAPIFINGEIRCISESKRLKGSWRILSSGEAVYEGTF